LLGKILVQLTRENLHARNPVSAIATIQNMEHWRSFTFSMTKEAKWLWESTAGQILTAISPGRLG